MVDDLCLLPFQQLVINHDLLQGGHAYPKIQTQAFNISDVFKLSDYFLQVILICENIYKENTSSCACI